MNPYERVLKLLSNEELGDDATVILEFIEEIKPKIDGMSDKEIISKYNLEDE